MFLNKWEYLCYMEQKNVLVTTTTFPRWENDTTPSFVYELSQRLSGKYKIIVLAPHCKGAKKIENIGNLKVIRFIYFKPERLQKLCYGGGIIPNMRASYLAAIQMPLLIIFEFLRSYLIIKKEKIEIIHAHWILPQGFIGILLKKIFKLPILVTIHGSDLFPLKNRFFKSMQRFVIKNANFVTVNSPAARDELIKRFPEYSHKIKTIPMGIDTNLFNRRNLRKPSRYSKNKLLLFVGRLSDQKGLQYLIDSLQEVIRHYPNVKLLIIGEGAYKKFLIDKSISKSVELNIEFLGPLSHKDISYYYNIADIFVMPSLSNETGTESLGLALLEAMASGCAVIGTNVGGIPYIVKNGRNGVLIQQKNSYELSKAIITLLNDPKKSKKIGNNAAEFVKDNYSWQKISNNFIKVYQGILK